MQRAEDQVAGLGGGESERDGLEVAHLADQDDVGILAQRAPQGVAERTGMHADLALVHETALRLVHELDRILDGEDVAVEMELRIDIEASVVDLPDPVGSVTSTGPRSRCRLGQIGGMLSTRATGFWSGSCGGRRQARPCRNTLTRKRPIRSGHEKSSSCSTRVVRCSWW
jgi:hypothetical protein